MYVSVLSSGKVEDEEKEKAVPRNRSCSFVHSVIIGHRSGSRQQFLNVRPWASVITDKRF